MTRRFIFELLMIYKYLLCFATIAQVWWSVKCRNPSVLASSQSLDLVLSDLMKDTASA